MVKRIAAVLAVVLVAGMSVQASDRALAPLTGAPTLQLLATAPSPGANDAFQSISIGITLTTKLKIAPEPAAAGGDNFNGSADSAPAGEGEFQLEVSAILGRNASVLSVLKLSYESGGSTTIAVNRLYINVRHTFGLRGLAFRVGRDAITLGPIGLLLDEVFYEDDRRDGLQVWLPDLGPVRLYGFMQWALDDLSTTRWLAGGRAEVGILPGWTMGINARFDLAGRASDTGICPGVDCNTGSGWGLDVEGMVVPGAVLKIAYAAYTQTGDMARQHLHAILELKLERLIGLRRMEPVVTVWYKSLDPYTLPGGPGGTVPRGAFGTPDDFNLFNINDNLAAVGARLDLALRSNLGFFILGEWGAYKGGGPGYNVFSVGVAYTVARNVELKLTYNTYSVSGGSIVTSPISMIELANTRLLNVEVVAKW